MGEGERRKLFLTKTSAELIEKLFKSIFNFVLEMMVISRRDPATCEKVAKGRNHGRSDRASDSVSDGEK
jgi:hypothetical protein